MSLSAARMCTIASAVVGLEEVVDVERGFAEKLLAALLLEREQAALYRADRRRRDVAVARRVILRVVGDVLQHRPQVLQIDERQPCVVRDLERGGQHAGLGFVEIQHPREQQRPELGDRGANRMALRAERVPEHHRRRFEREAFFEPERGEPLLDLALVAARAGSCPARSPFTSAMKTGTPILLKPSAMRCNVTVFPVPVAPAISPWRFAYCGSRWRDSLDFATSIGSAIGSRVRPV